jgi:hypothetical protein
MRHLAIVLGALLAAMGCAAAAEHDCRPEEFYAGTDLAIAVVRRDAGRLAFFRNGEAAAGCPAAGEACRERAYLIAGNRVLAGRQLGDYRCAIYLAPNGQSRWGWLPAVGLALQAEETRPDWAGRWTAGPEHTIVIRRGRVDGSWQLDGNATYGAQDPVRVRNGAVHEGSFSATVTPSLMTSGTSVAFTAGNEETLPYDQGSENDCRLRLRRLGPYLIVDDNVRCGGANVSFAGIYWRAR